MISEKGTSIDFTNGNVVGAEELVKQVGIAIKLKMKQVLKIFI